MILIFLTLLSLLSLSSASAQDLPRYLLPAVVVTPGSANNSPDPDITVEVPANATPKAATLDDVLRGAPGVVVARAGGAGQPSSLFIRGAASEHTLVLLDGVELNDPAQPTGGFDFSTIDLNMVERVEIFKGPQALRFGSGAVGGVVNIVSKKGGGAKKWMGALRGGSHQTNQQSAAALGESATGFKYAISASRYESGGISAARGGAEKDGHSYLAAAVRLSTGDPDNEWEFISRTLRSNSDLDYSTSSTGPYFLAPDDPNYFVGDFQTVNAIKHHKQRGKWVSDLSLSHFYLHRRYENKSDTSNPAYFLDNRFANSLKSEKIFARTMDPSTTLALGPSVRYETTGSHSHFLTGGFADLSYKKDWRAQGGVRYDHHSVFGGQLTYAAGLGYRWKSSKTTLSTRLATAFKSPSLFQLHDATFGNHNLRPERVRGEEVSVEQLLKDTHTLRLTGFRYFYSELIQFSTRYENLASAKSYGVEAEYNKDLSHNFDLQFAYSYTDARNEQTGARLLRRPFHSYRVGAGARFSDSFSARAEYRAVGSRPDIGALTAAPTITQAYDVLDISATKAIGASTQITASVENALSASYEEVSGYGTPGLGFYLGLRSEL